MSAMVITTKQARSIAACAEWDILEDGIAIKTEPLEDDSVEVAVRPRRGTEVHGTRENGWKHFRVEPSGRTTLIPAS